MPTILGIDLAWSDRNESGLCILTLERDNVRCEQLEARRLSAQAIALLACDAAGPVLVAVDGPLIVGSERMAERQLSRVFGRFHAGAYFASEAFLAGMDALAGPETGHALAQRGFSLDPAELGRAEKLAIEVYPHPAHVVLFGLERRLAYKKGLVAARRAGLASYQRHLGAYLADREPRLAHDAVIERVLRDDPERLAGQRLKRLEDTLDALTCSLIGLHCLRHGPAGIHVFGTGTDGYIVVPGPLPPAAKPARRRARPCLS